MTSAPGRRSAAPRPSVKERWQSSWSMRTSPAKPRSRERCERRPLELAVARGSGLDRVADVGWFLVVRYARSPGA